MSKPKLLDLFSGAGGAGMGYHLAGFEVVGIDINPQPHYPFEFIQGDALEYAAAHGHEYDLIHTSPPCQFGSVLTPSDRRHLHLNLIPHTRHILMALSKPYIIENVEGSRSYLQNPLMLCGSMFDLPIWRHRYFENNLGLFLSPASCNHNFKPLLVSGAPRVNGKKVSDPPINELRKAMQIEWMTKKELDQALPPAYTQWLGLQAIQHLKGQAA